MLNKLNLTKEEIFLIDILFKKTKISIKKIKNLDYEKLIRISSSQLVIPNLYCEINRRNLCDYFPKDFINYIKQIYEVNRNRNFALKKEALIISDDFKINKIDFCFTKGIANIFAGLYKDIGERMLGDIDILVKEEDYEQAINISRNLGYKEIEENNIAYSYSKHFPRMVNKKKLGAIEIHKHVVNPKFSSYINGFDILQSRIKKSDTFIPNILNQLKICIYNYQINDFGIVSNEINYRAFYDFCSIILSNGIELKNLNKDIFTNKFLELIDIYLLTNFFGSKNRLRILKINLLRKFKFINCIKSYLDRKIFIKIFKFNTVKFLKDKDYRKFILYKTISNAR